MIFVWMCPVWWCVALSTEDAQDLEHAIELPKYEKKMTEYIGKFQETISNIRVGRAVPNIVSIICEE